LKWELYRRASQRFSRRFAEFYQIGEHSEWLPSPLERGEAMIVAAEF
jgi:hypothetical protein